MGTGRTKRLKSLKGGKKLLHLFACKLRVIKAPKKDVHVLGKGEEEEGQCNQ